MRSVLDCGPPISTAEKALNSPGCGLRMPAMYTSCNTITTTTTNNNNDDNNTTNDNEHNDDNNDYLSVSLSGCCFRNFLLAKQEP